MLDSFTSRRSRLGLACTLGALALTAAACGGDDDKTDSATSAAAGAAESVVSDATSSDTAATDTAAADTAATDTASTDTASTDTEATETAAAAESADVGSLSGKIAVDGSSTVGPLTSAVAEEFSADASGVQVTVGISGTGGGMEKLCAGEIDIADASRPIKDEEKAACDAKSITYAELPVALDGISIVVNTENDWATCLKVDDLKKMWNTGSKVKSWKDVSPDFPDEPLTLYGADDASGTYDFFNEEILGKDIAPRTDYTPSSDDNVLVQGVEGDKGALGYFGYGYFEENKDALKALEVDAGEGCVGPSPDTIKDGSYKPLSRPLFLYVNAEAAKRPEVKGFLQYYLEKASGLAPEIGMVAPDEAEVTTAQTELQKVTG